jgi:hypothetical protein
MRMAIPDNLVALFATVRAWNCPEAAARIAREAERHTGILPVFECCTLPLEL